MLARVLIIAGSDSGGGAGLQADIKTVTVLGGYAATAVTAVTVQDTERVHAVHPIPPDVVAAQIRVVMEDIGADAIKIGMIGTVAAGEAILSALGPYGGVPVVLDPVLVATSGDALGDTALAQMIRARFLPLGPVLTPNVPEAAALTGIDVTDLASLEKAARSLVAAGARGVLAKGGHLTDDPVTDFYCAGETRADMVHPRLETRHTHGTGCTLASALAVGIAAGMAPADAARRAVDFVAGAIAQAPGLGRGHGPLGHGWALPEG